MLDLQVQSDYEVDPVDGRKKALVQLRNLSQVQIMYQVLVRWSNTVVEPSFGILQPGNTANIKLMLGEPLPEDPVDQIKIRYRTQGGLDDSVKSLPKFIWIVRREVEQTDPNLHMDMVVPDSASSEILRRTNRIASTRRYRTVQLLLYSAVFFAVGWLLGKTNPLGQL